MACSCQYIIEIQSAGISTPCKRKISGVGQSQILQISIRWGERGRTSKVSRSLLPYSTIVLCGATAPGRGGSSFVYSTGVLSPSMSVCCIYIAIYFTDISRARMKSCSSTFTLLRCWLPSQNATAPAKVSHNTKMIPKIRSLHENA